MNMQTQSVSFFSNPVLARFPVIRLAFLGLILMELHKSGQSYRSPRGAFKRAQEKRVPQKTTQNTQPETVSLFAWWKTFFQTLALNLLIVATFGGLLLWQGPNIFYRLFPKTAEEPMAQAEELRGNFDLNVLGEEVTKRKIIPSQRSYKPAYNENLPEGDWLVIPRIGVRSVMQNMEDSEAALSTGIWWVPDFGGPGDRSKPMILAGHRYGFDWWWKDDYWRYHSFYLLPDLEPGDRVEVISGKRKWVYEIYGGEEGSEITDYQADLILYTCKHLESPVRIFRYAKLLEIQEESALGELN